jgi:Fur family ferric uptake transcriptional regulator
MERTIFMNFLSERGLKLTKERMAVLGQIFSIHGHFEPEHLYLNIRNSGTKASRASVYRTLNLLVESGLVERISRSEKGHVYEHTYGHRHHDHMICTTCGEVIEFFSENLEEIQNMICTKYHFTGTSHTLEIRGLCRTCQKRKK